jgi:hypothetical protein
VRVKTYPREDPLQNVKNSRGEREFFAVRETEKGREKRLGSDFLCFATVKLKRRGILLLLFFQLSSPRVALVCCPEENKREEQRELLHYRAGKKKERNRERNA